MKRFVEGVDRGQTTLFPERLQDCIDESNPVCVINAFVDALNLKATGYKRAVPEPTGRPSKHPTVLLKLYIYSHLNRVQPTRRLEREVGRNVELMGRLIPDHKTFANFRKSNGRAIRQVCAQFVILCRQRGDIRSRFKAVNTRLEFCPGQVGLALGADRGKRRALSPATRHG